MSPRRSRASVAASHYAAVDVPDRSGNPACPVRQQEGDDFGDILRRADTADRVEAVEALQRIEYLGLWNEALVDRTVYHGGRYGMLLRIEN